MGAPGYGYAAVVYDERVLVIGGVQNEYEGQPQDEFCDNAIWAARAGGAWELLPRPPWRPRRFHGVAVDGAGRLLVAGGEDHRGTTFRDVWSFDGSLWQELGEAPWSDGVPNAAAGTAAGAVVVVDQVVYELSTDSWKVRCQVPDGVRVTSCALAGEELFFGDFSDSVFIHCAGCWSSVKLPWALDCYTKVCAGPAGQRFVYQKTEDRQTKHVVIASNADWIEDAIRPLMPENIEKVTIMGADDAQCEDFVEKGRPWMANVETLKFPLTLVMRSTEGVAFGNLFELHGNEPRQLATAFVPLCDDPSVSMGTQDLLQVRDGIGILTCCGHFLQST